MCVEINPGHPRGTCVCRGSKEPAAARYINLAPEMDEAFNSAVRQPQHLYALQSFRHYVSFCPPDSPVKVV